MGTIQLLITIAFLLCIQIQPSYTFLTFKFTQRDATFLLKSTSEDENTIPSGDYEEPPQTIIAKMEPIPTIPFVASIHYPEIPTRYLISLDGSPLSSKTSPKECVMIDVPPYSHSLSNHIRSLAIELKSILITNKDCIHYNTAPGVYVSRSSDLKSWVEDFSCEVVMHRIDIPRDVRPLVTQVLDGYGPWAVDGEGVFVESGLKMKVLEWDEEKLQDFIEAGEEDVPPVDIRANEEGKDILAVYTPGHTMGSLCFVFPRLEVCCSGLTIPEDSDAPRLDHKGYISTNQGGVERQVRSSVDFVEGYADRFRVLLPSRGEVLVLEEGSVEERIDRLKGIVDKFAKVAKRYDSVGGPRNN